MMKNIFKYISILILLIFIINSSFAGGDCKIQNNPNDCKIKDTPKYLTKYMKNIKKIENNVKSAAKAKGYKSSAYDSDYSFKGYLNSIFEWSNYDLSHEYETEESRDGEVPKEVKRDVKKISKLKKKIKLVNGPKGEHEVGYEDICKGVSKEYCNFDKADHFTVNNVLSKLKKSAQRINNLLQNKATENNIGPVDTKIYGFPIDKIDKLKKDYSKKNQKQCLVATKQGLYHSLNALKKYECATKDSKDSANDLKGSQAKQWKIKKEWDKGVKNDKKVTKKLAKKEIGLGDPENTRKNAENYNDKNSKKDPTNLDQNKDAEARLILALKKLFGEDYSNDDGDGKGNKTVLKAMATIKGEQHNLSEQRTRSYAPNKGYGEQGNTTGDNGEGTLAEAFKYNSLAINEHTKTARYSKEICKVKQLPGRGDCGN